MSVRLLNDGKKLSFHDFVARKLVTTSLMAERMLAAAVVAIPIAAAPQGAPAAMASATKHDGKWHSVPKGTYWSDGKLPAGFSLAIELKFAPNNQVSVEQTSANEFQLLKSKDGDVIVAEF